MVSTNSETIQSLVENVNCIKSPFKVTSPSPLSIQLKRNSSLHSSPLKFNSNKYNSILSSK